MNESSPEPSAPKYTTYNDFLFAVETAAHEYEQQYKLYDGVKDRRVYEAMDRLLILLTSGRNKFMPVMRDVSASLEPKKR